MIEKMLKNISQFLPLKIDNSQWDNVNFHLHGPNWNFNSMCAWRISEENKVIHCCYDSTYEEIIDVIAGLSIVDVYSQNTLLQIDPVFILSNKYKLEIFSTDIFEPWLFSINEKDYYIACPNVPENFDPD